MKTTRRADKRAVKTEESHDEPAARDAVGRLAHSRTKGVKEKDERRERGRGRKREKERKARRRGEGEEEERERERIPSAGNEEGTRRRSEMKDEESSCGAVLRPRYRGDLWYSRSLFRGFAEKRNSACPWHGRRG